MLTVTASLNHAFESQLSLRNIPDQQRRDFNKWLWFYLDFDQSQFIGSNGPGYSQ